MPRSPTGASARRSPRVLIKSLERNALHTSRIRDMVRLDGNRSSVIFRLQHFPDAGKHNRRPAGRTRIAARGGGWNYRRGRLLADRRPQSRPLARKLILLVGAARFELTTPCPPGIGSIVPREDISGQTPCKSLE